MSTLSRVAAVALLPAAVAAGAWSTTRTIITPAQAGDGPGCEIHVSKRGRTTILEGIVLSSVPISGSYRLSVTSSGGGGTSDIEQSGAFTASGGEAARLGVVSLSGQAGTHTADLTIRWNGGSNHCSQRADG